VPGTTRIPADADSLPTLPTAPIAYREARPLLASDYTALLQHVGVASTDVGFTGDWGLYHSAYDNADSIEQIIDPCYASATAAAEISGLLALRLANNEVVPMRYSDYAADTLDLLAGLTPPAGTDVDEASRLTRRWLAATLALEAAATDLVAGGVTQQEQPAVDRVNAAILAQEEALTRPEGIPSRPWFKHQIWAPGLTTGYAAEPVPALAEAVAADDAAAFEAAAAGLEASLRAAAAAARQGIG